MKSSRKLSQTKDHSSKALINVLVNDARITNKPPKDFASFTKAKKIPRKIAPLWEEYNVKGKSYP